MSTRHATEFSGDAPILGYDITGFKLAVNEPEAAQVRTIFDLYLEHRSLTHVVSELNDRGWTTKPWTTPTGRRKQARRFQSRTLRTLLSNPLYIGKVEYEKQTYWGEHDAIVDRGVFQHTRRLLERGDDRPGVRRSVTALLRDRVHCKECSHGMSHRFSVRDNRLFRTYVCEHSPTGNGSAGRAHSLPASKLERFVVSQIQELAQRSPNDDETRAAVRKANQQRARYLTRMRDAVRRELGDLETRLANLAVSRLPEDVRYRRMLGAQKRQQHTRAQLKRVNAELTSLAHPSSGGELVAALSAFGDSWPSASPADQARRMQLLVAYVEFDARCDSVSIALSPTGAKALARRDEAA